MQFIPEQIIDQKAVTLGNAEEFSALVQSLKAQQPAILAYLFSPSFEMLTQSEKEYTMFLALVIWSAVLEVHPTQPVITSEQIEASEEHNWKLLQEQKVKDFREKLNAFFDGTSQEDLLAFVEDALIQDEDDIISTEGQEYVFVSLKTIIDCLHQNIKT